MEFRFLIMYSFAGESALDLGALRGRLQAMDRAALVRFGQAAAFMCSVNFREGCVNLRSYLGSANGSELVFKRDLCTALSRPPFELVGERIRWSTAASSGRRLGGRWRLLLRGAQDRTRHRALEFRCLGSPRQVAFDRPWACREHPEIAGTGSVPG
jgi:hypothetical protein